MALLGEQMMISLKKSEGQAVGMERVGWRGPTGERNQIKDEVVL